MNDNKETIRTTTVPQPSKPIKRDFGPDIMPPQPPKTKK